MRRGPIAVLVVLVGVLGLPAPARAEPPWPGPAVCAEGAITVRAPTPQTATLDYWLRPCTAADAAVGRRGFATYYHRAALSDGHITLPISAGGDSGTFADFDPRNLYSPVLSTPLALCLVVSNDVRVACVSFTWSPDGSVSIAPLPIDDPIVRKTVTPVGSHHGDPECAGCV